jgi:Flp pilus assembly protein TadG
MTFGPGGPGHTIAEPGKQPAARGAGTVKQTKRGRRTSSLRRFLAKDGGSVTFEAVIWLPVFAFMIWLVTETATVFGGEARVLHVVQDANRLYASGYFQNATDTENFIRTQLSQWQNTMTVSTSESGGIIHTTVTVPVLSMTGISAIQQFSGLSVTIASEQMAEG